MHLPSQNGIKHLMRCFKEHIQYSQVTEYLDQTKAESVQEASGQEMLEKQSRLSSTAKHRWVNALRQ